MSVWRRLARELHQRSVGQVVGLYLVGGWAAYQVVLGLYEGLGLPRWVPPAALLLLMAGIPVVALTAFAQHGLPKRSAQDPPAGEESAPNSERLANHAPAIPEPRARWQRLLTWRRSFGVGVAAFALLALATVGFGVMRTFGIGPVGTLVAKGVVDADERVVLADFQGGAADAPLARAVTEAVRMDLMQSQLIRLVEPVQLRAALQRMQRDPAAGLTEENARELAQREGLRAVLAGDIARLGTGNVLSLRVVSAQDGAVLASFRAVARDSSELIDAVDRLSSDLREKFGESIKNVRASAPLWRVSTSSLPALRKYTASFDEEFRGGDGVRAIALLEEAVALDSTFAMAWRKLGRALNNVGIRRGDALKATRRAYLLRDRLPELERYLTIADYEAMLGELPTAIVAYRNALQIDSTDLVAYNNLSLLLFESRDYAEAERLLRRGIQLGGTQFHWGNLIVAQFLQGKIAEAKRTHLRSAEVLPDNAFLSHRAVFFAASEGRYEDIDSIARALAARFPANLTARLNALNARRSAALLLGRLSQYTQLTLELEAFAASAKLAPEMLATALARAEVSANTRRDPERALREVQAALAAVPIESLPAPDRPYFLLAQIYADAGTPERATAALKAAEAAVLPEERTRTWRRDHQFIRAYVDLRNKRAATALEPLRTMSQPGGCTTCYLAELGIAYEATQQPDSARAVYERFLAAPQLTRIVVADPRWRIFVLERAGELHLAAGDTARAVQRFNEILRLWSKADPELQPRVRAIQARLATLRGPG